MRPERNRMMLDVLKEIQLAIRLRATKENTTTGVIVCRAVESLFPNEIKEAREILLKKEG